MTEPFYVSRCRVEKSAERHHRIVHMELGPALDMGVHGPAKTHYQLLDARDLPLPVDYIVAATGG